MNGADISQNILTDLQLPDSWADQLDLRRPSHLWRFLQKVLLRRLARVELPPGLPLNVPIPKYVLQEFHNLPNGNYSKKITRGYCRGFDLVMLGALQKHRRELAEALHHCTSVIDIGCGPGHSTQALVEAGVKTVWGLDASPYMLQHAVSRYPQLHFVQGLAEETRLPAAFFDGLSACFVFHEIPPRHADRALQEFRRILKPGGRIALLEPATEQFFCGPLALLKAHGWRGVYFWWLARFVHEPFVRAWHERNIQQWLGNHGFKLLSDYPLFPSRLIVAQMETPG